MEGTHADSIFQQLKVYPNLFRKSSWVEWIRMVKRFYALH